MGMVQAGVSRVTITPPVGIYLIGFAGRPGGSRGVRDDLYATTLALSDGATEAAIVSCDLLIVHPDLAHRVRQDVCARTGIPGENILFCATHTHSGPGTYVYSDSPPVARAYVDNLAFLLSGAIQVAHDRLAPAAFGFGRGQACIGINRRLTPPDGVTVIAANPDGPVDPEVGVLRVDTAEGQPLAVVVNHACHPVVLGEGSNVISADWPGAMRRVVEQATGATCLFIQGACGDINPLPGEPTDDGGVLERLGTIVGGEVVSAWAGAGPKPTDTLRVCSERLLVPLVPHRVDGDRAVVATSVAPSTSRTTKVVTTDRPLPHCVESDGAVVATSVAPSTFRTTKVVTTDRPLVELAGAADSREALVALLNASTPWSAEVIGEGDERRAVLELGALRVGETALVSAAGEVFVKTGLAVKRRSAIANTMFAAYANGLVGYFPLPEDYPRGGYEVDESYLFYRLPAPLAPAAAGMLEDTAVRLLNKIV
jgi:hypothetical protein